VERSRGLEDMPEALTALLIGQCSLQGVSDPSCQQFANAYLKYTHYDQMIQKQEDIFVKDNQTLVTVGGIVYLIGSQHANFPLYSGLMVNINAGSNPGVGLQYNFGF
jgi:hypothetical protein